MTVFVVGPDDRGFFKKQRTTWEFEDALNQASDGDNILIKQGYQFPIDDKNYVIDKSIKISSEVKITMLGGLLLKNGAQVRLDNLSLWRNKEKTNVIQVRENSKLIATNVVLTNRATTGKNYPIVYIDGGSNVKFDNLYIEKDQISDGAYRIYAEKSNLEVYNSNLNCKVNAVESIVNLQNTFITYNDSNAINLQSKTQATLKNVTIVGGLTEKDYPCVWVGDSTINLIGSIVRQSNYSAALCLQKGAYAEIDSSRIDSIAAYNSELNLRNASRISESIFVKDHSTLIADVLLIDGKNNGKVNIYMTQKSSFKANWVGFAFETSPNIKIEDNVTFDVPDVFVLKFDSDNDKFILNEENNYPILKSGLQKKIKYFTNKKKQPKEEKTSIKDPKKSGMQQLDEMIGLKNVKQQVKEFIAVAVLNKKRTEKGLTTSSQTLHSLFLGNPGTGKTTVARIIGHVLYEKGVIAEDKLIETSRADLVAGYIGQTAEKTRKILESALGGILFIDEAYTLANGGQNDFGKEAIDEILKFMEDHRSNIMIIFAGYTNDMEKFLETNPGLRSRIPNKFDFEDYTVDEMVKIGLFSLKKQQYHVNPSSYADLLKNNLSKDNDNSNGRWVRNLNDKIIKKQALRVALNDSYSKEDLVNITDADLEAVRL